MALLNLSDTTENKLRMLMPSRRHERIALCHLIISIKQIHDVELVGNKCETCSVSMVPSFRGK